MAAVSIELWPFAAESLFYAFPRTFMSKFRALQLLYGEHGGTSVISNAASSVDALPQVSSKSCKTSSHWHSLRMGHQPLLFALLDNMLPTPSPSHTDWLSSFWLWCSGVQYHVWRCGGRECICLHCAAFSARHSCHAIYEGYQLNKVAACSRRSNTQVTATDALLIAHYLIKLTEEFKLKAKDTE